MKKYGCEFEIRTDVHRHWYHVFVIDNKGKRCIYDGTFSEQPSYKKVMLLWQRERRYWTKVSLLHMKELDLIKENNTM